MFECKDKTQKSNCTIQFISNIIKDVNIWPNKVFYLNYLWYLKFSSLYDCLFEILYIQIWWLFKFEKYLRLETNWKKCCHSTYIMHPRLSILFVNIPFSPKKKNTIRNADPNTSLQEKKVSLIIHNSINIKVFFIFFLSSKVVYLDCG